MKHLLPVLLLLAALFAGATASAQTTVGGALVDANTTWNVAGSPYVMNSDVVIQVGQTLTIEPGVVVQASDGESRDIELIVRGTLVAAGTAAQPIEFRSATLTAAGSWEGIRSEAGALVTLQHAVLRHADYPLELAAPVVANYTIEDVTIETFANRAINLTSASGGLTMSDVSIVCPTASQVGVYTDRVTLGWSGGRVKGCAYGIVASSASVQVDHVVFDGNGDAVQAVVQQVGTYSLDVDYCTFWNNTDGIDIARGYSSSYVLNTSVRRSIFGQNGVAMRESTGSSSYKLAVGTFSRVVWWGTTLSSGFNTTIPESEVLRYNALLADPANGNYEPTDRSPARYFGPTTPSLTIGAIPHAGTLTGDGIHGFHYVNRTFTTGTTLDVSGDVVIAPGVSFGFQPNVRLRMATTDVMSGGVNTGKIEIRVEGTLEGDGTTNFPIRFQSGAATPARGDWYGIIIPSINQAYAIANVEVAHAIRGISLETSTRRVLFSTIRDCSEWGIHVSGGTPEIQFTDLNDNRRGLLATSGATVSMTDVDVRRSTEYGARFDNATASWTTGRVHDNGSSGIEVWLDQVATRNVYLTSLTVAHNTGAGLYFARGYSSSYGLTVTTANSAFTHNGTFGVQEATGSSSYRLNLSCLGSNSWGNPSGNYTVPNPPTTGSSCVSWNPLYVDAAGRDYTPTSRSPHRALGNAGARIGADAYDGDQTLELMGFTWDGLTLTEDASPHDLVGDLYVPAGTTLSLESGAVVRVASSDAMGGGLHTGRTEVRTLQGGTLDTPDAAPYASFRSAAATPVYGSWYGFRFDNASGFTVRYLETQHAQYGAWLEGPAAPPFEDFRSMKHDVAGIYANNVSTGNGVELLAVELIGDGGGTGVSLQDSNARIRSSYVTHHSYGIDTYLDLVATRTVYLVNNTIVGHTDGIRYARGLSSSYVLNMRIHNNVIAANTSAAIRDATTSSTYSVNDRLTYNNTFGVSTLSLSADSQASNITSDPRIEDNDWNGDPRWWDGKLWANSLAINAGSSGVEQFPSRDITGGARTIGASPDMGAWEFDPDRNEEPRADAVGGDQMVPTGELATYNGAAAFDPDGTIAAAYWTFSDGTVLAGQTVQHTFATAGSRWAYITVVDNQGAEDHALVNVNVNTRPVAEAGPPLFQDDVAGGSGEFVAPAESSSDPDGSIASWSWNWGDGTANSTGRAPTHQYTAAGVYLITLTVTDNEGLTHVDTTTATVLTSDGSDTVGPLVLHTEIADGQPLGAAVQVNAVIQDTSDVDSAFVQYRRIGTSAPSFVAMSRISGDNWRATIPSAAVQSPGIEYWIIAFDGADPQNQTTLPTDAPTADVFDFLVTGDPDAPVITHTEIADGRPPSVAVTISATITDATGVGSANLYFGALGSTSFGAVPMTRIAGNLWSADIPAYIVAAPGVRYYIEATDTSPIPNRGVAPAGAPTTTWDFTVGTGDNAAPFIAHTAPAGPLSAGNPVTLTAGVVDSGGTGTASGIATVTLSYRTNGGSAFTAAAMTLTSGSTYSVTIPGAGVQTPGLEYHIEAADVAGNVGRSPDGATFHTVVVSNIDNIGPTIVHTPVADGQAAGANVNVSATVTDATGVASVRLFYRPSGYPFYQEVGMTAAGGGVYEGAIPGFAVAEPHVDYYLRATDTASPANITTSPAGAPGDAHRFTVGAVDATPPTLLHTRIPDGQEVGEDVLIEAVVFDDSGIGSATLFYRQIGQPAYTELAMAAGDDDVYAATLPGSAVSVAGVEYYLRAVDASAGANAAYAPAAAPGTTYTFTGVVTDVTPPSVTIPAIAAQTAGVGFGVTANASDASTGIVSVTLRYRPQGTPTFTEVPMTSGAGSWSASIPGAAVVVPALELQAVAVDGAGNPGLSSLVTVIVNAPPDATAPSIALTPVADGRTSGTAVPVTATITDTSGIAAAALFYRASGGGAYTQIAMTAAGDVWSATIPGAAVVVPGVQYYVTATDASPASNAATAPATAPGTPASFTVTAADVAGPTITHTALTGPLTTGDRPAVRATVTDPASVASVTLYWRTAGGASWTSVAMSLDGGEYAATIGPVVAPSLEYYFFAIDGLGNTSSLPLGAPGAPYEVDVVDPDVSGPVITHTPVPNGRTAGTAVAINATATDATGVAALSLNYRVTGAPAYTRVAMTNAAGTWSASIPGASVTTAGVQYYIEAADTLDNASVAPSTAPGTPYSFTAIVVDLDPPTVSVVAPGPQTEGVAFDVTINASDAISAIASVTLRYRAQGTSVFATVAATGSGPYTARIPAAAVVAPGLELQAVASDTFGNVGQSTISVVTVNAPPDTAAPTITLTPVGDGQLAGAPVLVSANVTDVSGVLSATLSHRVEGASVWTTLPMARSGATWSATIPGDAVQAPGVQYYVSATDAAPAANVGVAPATAPGVPARFGVTAVDGAGPTIVHSVGGTIAAGAMLDLAATVTDASGVASVSVFWRTSGGGAYAEVAMTRSGDSWATSVGPVSAPGVQYYFRATDTVGNVAQQPTGTPYAVNVIVPDLMGPTIVHTPIVGDHAPGSAQTVFATVTDVTGVASVTLHYRTAGGGPFTALAMARSGDSWSAAIPAGAVVVPGVDYYLVAVDSAPTANEASSPADAPTTVHAFTVSEVDTTGPGIVTDGVASPQLAGEVVVVDAVVTDRSGVDTVTVFVDSPADPGATNLIEMTRGEGDSWSAVIPAALVVEGTVHWFIEAADLLGNIAYAPSSAPTDRFAFVVEEPVGEDTLPPIVVHTPVEAAPRGVALDLSAVVSDASGVREVAIFFRGTGDSDWLRVPMTGAADDNWTGRIPASTMRAEQVEYYLFATDDAVARNEVTDPAGAPDAFHTIVTAIEDGDAGPDAGDAGDTGDTSDSTDDAGASDTSDVTDAEFDTSDGGDTTDASDDAAADAAGDVTEDATSDATADAVADATPDGGDVSVDGSGEDVGAPDTSAGGSSRGGGCAAGGGAVSSLFGFALALLALFRRRRLGYSA